MADPKIYYPGPVDLLFGPSIFWDLLCSNQIKSNNHSPILQETLLGWILSGVIRQQKPNQSHCYFSNIELHNQKNWKTGVLLLPLIVKKKRHVKTTSYPRIPENPMAGFRLHCPSKKAQSLWVNLKIPHFIA